MNINIRQVQRLLRNLGHDPGNIDGVWGPNSQAALDAAQTETGTNAADQSASFWDDIQFVPRAEWRCPCGRCGGFPVEPQEGIVRFLDALRAHFGRPVDISSGVRCAQHNAELPGSVYNSRHLSGKAVDFRVRGLGSAAVKAYCDNMVAAGILRYCYCIDGEFVHADIL